MSSPWDDLASHYGATTPDPDYAPVGSATPTSPPPSALSMIASPLWQGATYGLAGNTGLLPADYSKQRSAHPWLYPALESAGEFATGAALLPELQVPKTLGRVGSFAARAGYNALAGGAIGAASTNVSGGDLGDNALLGAGGAMVLSPLASAASALAPKVAPKVGKYLDAYSSMFGKESRTREQMSDEISGMFQKFVKNAGGIDLLTTVPEITDASGSIRYPAQTLGDRLNAIRGREYRGAAETGSAVGDVVDNLLDVAKSNKGVLGPDDYTRFTQRGGDVANLSRSGHALGKLAGGDIRDSLDDALALQSSGLAERFNVASKAHKEAVQGVQDASNELTLANSRFLPTDNVYANSSTFPAVRAATAKLESAQARADAAGAEKDKITTWLRGAQSEEASQTAPDLEAINDARSAFQLWKIADSASSGGKMTSAKLARVVNKQFKTAGEPVPTTDELAKVAASPTGTSWLHRLKVGGEYGMGATLGATALEHLVPEVSRFAETGGGLATLGVGGGLAGTAALTSLLRRSAPMARAAVAKSIGQPNPLLNSPLFGSSAAVTGAALVGAGGQKIPPLPDDPWEALSQTYSGR